MSKKTSSADNQQERLLTPDYIVGLVDGEGYFSVTPQFRNYDSYNSYEVNMVFGIELKESDGRILKEIQKWFGCGNLYHRVDKRKNFCNLVIYRVRNHRDILGRVIPFFQKHSLRIPSKQRKFKYFAKVGRIVTKKEYSNPEGFKKVQELVAKMRQ